MTYRHWSHQSKESTLLTPDPNLLLLSNQSPTPFVPTYTPSKFSHSCDHSPHLILSGMNRGKKWGLYLGAKSKVEDRAWEFDMIVNLTGTSITSRTNIIPPRPRAEYGEVEAPVGSEGDYH